MIKYRHKHNPYIYFYVDDNREPILFEIVDRFGNGRIDLTNINLTLKKEILDDYDWSNSDIWERVN